MGKEIRRIVALVSSLVTLTLATVALAALFTPGNPVIYRVGDGVQTMFRP